jgi:hypothetical protein
MLLVTGVFARVDFCHSWLLLLALQLLFNLVFLPVYPAG